MKIYGYDTFLKQKENVTKIKIKDWTNVSNKDFYNRVYEFWVKKLNAVYEENNFFAVKNEAHVTIPNSSSFYDNTEVVNELEIE